MKNFKKIGNFYGFTLIELLIVVAVIAILAAIAFVALNPLARFQDSRNARRWSDINMIMSAIKLNQVDNGGAYVEAVDQLFPNFYYQLGAGDSCSVSCINPDVTLQSTCVDLEELVDDAYLPYVPVDPGDSDANADGTRYYLVKDSYGRLIVGACTEEKGSNAAIPTIEITR